MGKGEAIIEYLVLPLPKSETVTMPQNWEGENNWGLHRGAQ